MLIITDRKISLVKHAKKEKKTSKYILYPSIKQKANYRKRMIKGPIEIEKNRKKKKGE